MASDYFSRPRPRLFGHRGAAGLAPENTLASFEQAVADGAGYLELDVHATRDGVVVAIHDATLERTTDASGRVRDRTFAELRAADAGHRFERDGAFPFRGRGVGVPSLEEVIDAFPDVGLNVEIKQAEPAIESCVVELVRRRGAADRVLLAAEDDAIMRRIRAAGPELSTSLSFVETREFFERFFAGDLEGYRPPGRALQIPPRFSDIDLVTPETVAAAHAAGLEIHVWTIDDESEIARLLALGVDGVMSDYPARLVAAARR